MKIYAEFEEDFSIFVGRFNLYFSILQLCIE